MNYMPQYADINSAESLALWVPFQLSMQSVMVQQLPGFQMISLTTITQTTIVANIGRRKRRQAAAEDGIAIGFDTIFNAQKVVDAIESGDFTSNMTIDEMLEDPSALIKETIIADEFEGNLTESLAQSEQFEGVKIQFDEEAIETKQYDPEFTMGRLFINVCRQKQCSDQQFYFFERKTNVLIEAQPTLSEMQNGTCVELCDVDLCGENEICRHTNVAVCDMAAYNRYMEKDTEFYNRTCEVDPNYLPAEPVKPGGPGEPFARWKIAVIVVCLLLLIAIVAILGYWYHRRTRTLEIQSRFNLPPNNGPNDHGSITLYA